MLQVPSLTVPPLFSVHNFQDLEHFLQEDRCLMCSCKCLFRSSLKPSAKKPMAPASTLPWSVLDSIGVVKTPVREILEDLWFANTMASSSLKAWFRGVAVVLPLGNMVSTPESAT